MSCNAFAEYLNTYATRAQELTTIEQVRKQAARKAGSDVRQALLDGSGLGRFTSAVERLASVGVDFDAWRAAPMPEDTVLSTGGDAE